MTNPHANAPPLLLLVDDQPVMATIVRRLCRSAGVEVLYRPCVADGVAALQERTPELLLLDMRLSPIETGADLCRKVRATPNLASLPVALFTDWEMDRDISAGLAAGADFVFAKNLVGDEGKWRERLAEILAWTRGRVWETLVACNTEPAWPSPPLDWLAIYNRTLQQALIGRLTARILHVVLQLAIRKTHAHLNRPADARAWLHPEGTPLLDASLVSAVSPETVVFLGAALAEQMWCLLGTLDSASFTEALARVVPGLTEAIPNR
jgi:CheY-like chemotaxis protein